MAASRFNGKLHSTEGKTPFLIGVAGGTASGKTEGGSIETRQTGRKGTLSISFVQFRESHTTWRSINV